MTTETIRTAHAVGTPSVLGTFFAWATVARQRLQLRNMDQRLLDDIGLTGHEAEIEANRPFWDVPASWRR
ncbi:MAG: DUF1127 domain-containing protein [Pseudomonadota bacterium]